jgi:hypothetical protein
MGYAHDQDITGRKNRANEVPLPRAVFIFNFQAVRCSKTKKKCEMSIVMELCSIRLLGVHDIALV